MNTTSRSVCALALGALLAVACAPEKPLPPTQNSEFQGDGGPSGGGPGGTVINPPDGGVPAGDAAPPDDAGASPGLDVIDRSETGVRDASGSQDAPEPRDATPADTFAQPDAFAPPDL